MNGSGCIAGGELAPMPSDRRFNPRRIFRNAALLAALFGAILLGIRSYSLFSRSFAAATVEGVFAQEGECRRPSGRYQHCSQSRVTVLLPIPGKEPIHGEVFIAARGVSVKVGEQITVGYRAENPSDMILPELKDVATMPLAFLLLGLFLVALERLTRPEVKQAI